MADADDAARRAIAALDHQFYASEAAERLKHQVALVERGLQSLMLVNGGALVALFALIGSSARLAIHPRYLWAAFAFFALGLVFTMLAHLGAFLSQGFYAQATMVQLWDAQREMHGLAPTRDPAGPHRKGRHAELGGIVAALLALRGFVIGCGLAFVGVLPG